MGELARGVSPLSERLLSLPEMVPRWDMGTSESGAGQSVKTTREGNERGYDAGKKVKGRKRHILVDTLGQLLNVITHTASLQDRDCALYYSRHSRRCYPCASS